MAKDIRDKGKGKGKEVYTIEGKIQFEALNEIPGDVDLLAYVFTDKGELIGTSPVNQDGKYILQFSYAQSSDFELHIGAAEDSEKVRKSSLYSRNILAQEWAQSGENRILPVVAYLPKVVWWSWWPKQICVSGHVRKSFDCPIPFTKVEIFDVDRHWCFWPHLHLFKHLLRKNRVLRLEDIVDVIPDIPDLVREIPEPVAPPFTASLIDKGNISSSSADTRLSTELLSQSRAVEKSDFGRISLKSDNIDFNRITATSKLAPWILFPGCYYHKHLVCTTTTDENGFFRCCFRWRPLHAHHGHHNYDLRPDIIIRVTQEIDGVSKVIYMDPYANTRWNVSNLHVDLYLDDPDIECGEADDQVRPDGSRAFFTRIGNDEVYKINQSNGTYNTLSAINNMAYGRELRIYAQFGDTLSKHENIPGASSPYYYKLSYDGIPITTALSDTRVNKVTLSSESYSLGPKPVGSETALFEIRDFEDYYWYNPDWIGKWITAIQSIDELTKEPVIDKKVSDGVKTLKLEIYDQTGTLLDSSKVEYLDGTIAPPAVLPPKYPCTMKIAIDNNPPVLNMQISPLPTGCGVINSADVPPLNVSVSVSQANNRVKTWSLTYVKGTNPAVINLDSHSNNSGGAGVNMHPVSANSLLTGLTSTCAFSIKLNSWAHVRNGYGLVYYRELRQAIAIEHCP